MSFKERLKEEISYQGLQLKEVALKANISKRTLDTYVDKRERMPAADVAVRLANALNVSVEYLVTGEEKNNIPKKNAFYDKYIKFEPLLNEISKLSYETYLQLEPVLLATIKGLQNTELEKKKKDV